MSGNIRLYNTGGYVELQAPSSATNQTLVLPTDSIQPGLVHLHTETFSAVSSVSLDNVFSSTYDNYRIVTNVTTSANAQIRIRMRSSGTDLTSSYNWGSFSTASTTGYNQYLSQSEVDLFYVPTGQGSGVVDIFAPYLSLETRLVSDGVSNYLTAARVNVFARVSNTNSYDGFTLYPSNPSFTGTLRVYGYRNS